MARKKQIMFTREQVEYVAKTVLGNTLANCGQSLLTSGAQPSPEIGVIIMHLANGSTLVGQGAEELRSKMVIESPEQAEIFAALQEIIGEQSK